MSTNDLLIIMLIIVRPTAGVFFYPNTILLHILSIFKTVDLIILNKTENHQDVVCLKIYALILAILICYLNLQHLKNIGLVSQTGLRLNQD